MRLKKLCFEAAPCLCGLQSTRPVLRRDRYLLPMHVAVCGGCGLVHSARTIPAEGLEHFYTHHYRDYYENLRGRADIERARPEHQRNAQLRLAAIGEVVPEISSVLEIGSGMGAFLEACRAQGVPHLLGFEPGNLLREYATGTLGLPIRGEDYARSSPLPFTPTLVVLFHVLEHLAAPDDCLRWIAQQMQADGTLVIEVPDISGDWKAMGLFNFHIAHRWYFSPVTLANLLAQCGFVPYFISRSDSDGIYPGNLRIFARLGDAGDTYPLTPLAADEQAQRIRAWVRPFSLHHGFPRALWRLGRQRLTRRTGISPR